MVQFQPRVFLALMLCALILYAACCRYDPRRLHGRILSRCVSGVLLMLAWNLVMPLRLGVNPLSACVAGSLGLPGLGLLAVIRLL